TRAILADEPLLHRETGQFALHEGVEQCQVRLEIIAMNDLLKRLSNQFRARVAEDFAQLLVGAQAAVMAVHVGNADGRVLERSAEPLLAFPQRLLGQLALCDVFREPGDSIDFPRIVSDGESVTSDPAERAIRPRHPELRVRGYPAELLLQLHHHQLPIIGMDAVDPGSRVFVQALARSPPDLFVGWAHVKRSLPPAVLHPEHLANALCHLTEYLLTFAQPHLDPLALAKFPLKFLRATHGQSLG